jgi:hypothetical protein
LENLIEYLLGSAHSNRGSPSHRLSPPSVGVATTLTSRSLNLIAARLWQPPTRFPPPPVSRCRPCALTKLTPLSSPRWRHLPFRHFFPPPALPIASHRSARQAASTTTVWGRTAMAQASSEQTSRVPSPPRADGGLLAQVIRPRNAQELLCHRYVHRKGCPAADNSVLAGSVTVSSSATITLVPRRSPSTPVAFPDPVSMPSPPFPADRISPAWGDMFRWALSSPTLQTASPSRRSALGAVTPTGLTVGSLEMARRCCPKPSRVLPCLLYFYRGLPAHEPASWELGLARLGTKCTVHFVFIQWIIWLKFKLVQTFLNSVKIQLSLEFDQTNSEICIQIYSLE